MNLTSGKRPFAWADIFADFLAGLAVAGLLVPEGMGYSGIAGLPAQTGLYAATLSLAIYALAGSSKHLVVSPTSSSAATLAAAIAALITTHHETQAASTFAIVLVTGVLLSLAGFLRLGFVAEFISKPVLKGFVFGIAINIIIKQLPKLMGLESHPGNALIVLGHLVSDLPSANAWTCGIGFISLALLILLKRLAPRIPGALLVLALGIASYPLLELGKHGVAIVGQVPAGLPGFSFALLPWEDWTSIVPSAVGLSLVIFAESMGAARNFASKYGYDIDANKELKSLGAANVAAALLQGMTVGGGTSATAANDSAGAKSRLSSLCAAFVLLATLLWFTPLFHNLPEAVLGAIVIHAVAHLADFAELKRYARLKTGELRPSLVALAGVPLFGILPGLLLAMGLTLIELLRGLLNTHLVELGRLPGTRDYLDRSRHPESEAVPGMILVRLDKPLFFASANRIHGELRSKLSNNRASVSPSYYLISMELAPTLDVTSIDMLRQFRGEAAAQGWTLAFARIKDELLDLFERSGFLAELGKERIFWSVDDAVQALKPAPSRILLD